VKVVAARRLRVGRCHGKKIFNHSSMPIWWLWLACGHITKRSAKKIPRSVVCHACQWDREFGYRKKRDWKEGDISDDFGIIRF